MKKRGGDAAEWYGGVRADEGWGKSLGKAGVAGAYGAIDGGVTGAMGVAGGPAGKWVAGKIAAPVAKRMGTKALQTGATWAGRTVTDAALGTAGDVAGGTAKAGVDSMQGRDFKEAWEEHAGSKLTREALFTTVVSSGFGSTMSHGDHVKDGKSVKDRLVGSVAKGDKGKVVAGAAVDSAQSVVSNGASNTIKGDAFFKDWDSQAAKGAAGSVVGDYKAEAKAKAKARAKAAAGGA